MNISITNLGVLSNEETAQTKFILTEDGVLLFGTCMWHKDLSAQVKLSPNTKIIGAGIVPNDLTTCSIDEDEWGGWKSTGYGIVTPQELRFPIKEAFFAYAHTAKTKE